ncbi:TLC domain-containing protein At5g14285 [Hevea brasiliensis]|uniref:TLC domain-containing protein At5g14285 n=1 Tax=Hevea brasiliensis TaxID=3981 RepID=UPI0025F73679|nr:TLC domain-containing protein At5g14285 [Hevea brasiliensis]
MDATVLNTLILPTSFMMFLSVYLLAYFIVFRNWGLKNRAEASSSFMSLAHGSPAVIFAVRALLHTQTSYAFASPNSTFHDRVLEFSMAYFLMDLLHYIVFFPTDILLILHHLATLYVLVTCRYMVPHGAYGILVLLILAEVTSPCQNVWSIARFRKNEVPAAARLYEFLSPPFLAFYSVVRGILGPFFAFKMGVFYLRKEGDDLVPGWAWISWMVVTVTAILVSILWVSKHWIDWLRKRSLAQKKLG